MEEENNFSQFLELYAAVMDNDNDKLSMLLLNSSDMIFNYSGDWHYSPLLHCALTHRNINALEILLKQDNIDVSVQNFSRLTPLQYALKNNINEAITILLNHGKINENIQNCLEEAPLQYVLRNNITDAIIEIVNHNKTDVNIQNIEIDSPLHYAIKSNNISALTALLKHKKIDVNIQEIEGYTPLHFGIIYNNRIAINMLLKHINIDVNIPDNYGKTAEELLSDPNLTNILLEDKQHFGKLFENYRQRKIEENYRKCADDDVFGFGYAETEHQELNTNPNEVKSDTDLTGDQSCPYEDAAQ